jgi:HAD superfamily hydrolase (TIGR01490 family)
MAGIPKIAFYDLDGTLVSSNIVTRYSFFLRHLPSRARSVWKLTKLVASVPAFVALNYISRQMFNEVFFREYRGMNRDLLFGLSGELFDQVVRPSLYPGARELIDRDRAEGFRPVLVTGEVDVALGPLVSYMGFESLICNHLVFENGLATGEIVRPLIAERAKADAMAKLCRSFGARMSESKGYSDSFSDVPMLEAVGNPAAVNPDGRLRKVAAERHWPILELRRRSAVNASPDEENHVHLS